MKQKIISASIPFLLIFGILTIIYFSGKISNQQFYDPENNIIFDTIINAVYTKDSIITQTKQKYKIIYKFETSTEKERIDIVKNIVGYEIMISKNDKGRISDKEFLLNMNNPAGLNLQ